MEKIIRQTIIIFMSIFLLAGCSGDEEVEDPELPFEISGTYCLNFSIPGSELVITNTDEQDVFQVAINDYDGGIRSGSGIGQLSNNVINVTGTMTIEAGEGNFEAQLTIDSENESATGEFNVIDDQNNVLFNSSLHGVKGNCQFGLDPTDIDQIIGQPLLTAQHVELNKIKKISKYRSAAGHNFVDYSGESCVNLKHYFHTFAEGEPPADDQLPASVRYYAPANGTIVVMGQARPSEDPTDYEIDIRLAANENVIVRIFHVNPESNIAVGSTVYAGQLLGEAPAIHRHSGDFAVYVLTTAGYRHISMFEIMSNELLSGFHDRGVANNWKSDLYYSEDHAYVNDIFCENGNWGNLRHPESRFELDFFILDE